MSARVTRRFLCHPTAWAVALTAAGVFGSSPAPSPAGQPTPKEHSREPVVDGKTGAEWVDTLVNGTSARARALAVEALGKLWRDQLYPEALPNLGRALRMDPSAAVRTQAAMALGNLRPAELKVLPRDLRILAENARKDLVLAMGSEKESRVRREIAVALSRDPALVQAALPGLTAALKDPAPATLVAVAEALSQAGAEAKGAAAELVPLLDHAEPAVRRAAVMALGRIAPEGAAAIAVTLAQMLRTETDAELKLEILTSLELLGQQAPTVVEAIAATLAAPEEELRRRAILTLGSFGTGAKAAADALLKTARSDPVKDVRVDAVHSLGSVWGPEGIRSRVAELLAMLADPDHEVRIAILDEVGALGEKLKDDPASIKLIRQRLSDPHLKVREAAAIALRKITETKKDDPPGKPEPKP